jgi:hypothetical protein
MVFMEEFKGFPTLGLETLILSAPIPTPPAGGQAFPKRGKEKCWTDSIRNHFYRPL